MRDMRDKLIDLIKDHEEAHVRHTNAVKDHKEYHNEATHIGVLETGATVSATGARLQGFVEGIFTVAVERFKKEEDL